MRAKFIGQANDGSARVFDTEFPSGKWVDVDHLHPAHQHKLFANPTFETTGDPPEISEETRKQFHLDPVTRDTEEADDKAKPALKGRPPPTPLKAD